MVEVSRATLGQDPEAPGRRPGGAAVHHRARRGGDAARPGEATTACSCRGWNGCARSSSRTRRAWRTTRASGCPTCGAPAPLHRRPREGAARAGGADGRGQPRGARTDASRWCSCSTTWRSASPPQARARPGARGRPQRGHRVLGGLLSDLDTASEQALEAMNALYATAEAARARFADLRDYSGRRTGERMEMDWSVLRERASHFQQREAGSESQLLAAELGRPRSTRCRPCTARRTGVLDDVPPEVQATQGGFEEMASHVDALESETARVVRSRTRRTALAARLEEVETELGAALAEADQLPARGTGGGARRSSSRRSRPRPTTSAPTSRRRVHARAARQDPGALHGPGACRRGSARRAGGRGPELRGVVGGGGEGVLRQLRREPEPDRPPGRRHEKTC